MGQCQGRARSDSCSQIEKPGIRQVQRRRSGGADFQVTRGDIRPVRHQFIEFMGQHLQDGRFVVAAETA